MYNDSRCKINDKMNIVKTILLRWKESIVLTDENKEKNAENLKEKSEEER